MRRLTAEEASKVTEKAKGENRPELFVASLGMNAQISEEFEVWLILTPISTRNQIASFFRTILENDPNDLQTKTQLLTEFLEEELQNESEKTRNFQSVTEFYDTIRSSYSGTIDGFTDVGEVSLLQEALTNSLGPIAEERDRHIFNVAVLNVLNNRLAAAGTGDIRRELESWAKVLVSYD